MSKAMIVAVAAATKSHALDQFADPALLLLIAGVLLIAYFIPAMVAYMRGHHNRGAILVLNLFLGWSFLGWVAALVWAATRVRREPSRFEFLERREPR